MSGSPIFSTNMLVGWQHRVSHQMLNTHITQTHTINNLLVISHWNIGFIIISFSWAKQRAEHSYRPLHIYSYMGTEPSISYHIYILWSKVYGRLTNHTPVCCWTRYSRFNPLFLLLPHFAVGILMTSVLVMLGIDVGYWYPSAQLQLNGYLMATIFQRLIYVYDGQVFRYILAIQHIIFSVYIL